MQRFIPFEVRQLRLEKMPVSSNQMIFGPAAE
jgi:hypothetical protein